MAQQLYFSRDTRVYVKKGTIVWEVPVLDGFSFSQATNSSEITLAEMESSGGVSRRGRKQFNDSLAPAEWSFSTYIRPFASAGSGAGAADDAAKVHAVEEILWALFSGPATYASNTFTNQFVTDTADLDIDFSESNKSTLGTADIYFVLGNANKKVYKLKDSVVNEASLDFDIDGIATIGWSGMSSELLDVTGSTQFDDTLPVASDVTGDGSTMALGDVWIDTNDNARLHIMTNVTSGSEAATSNIYEAVGSTTNFIRNRLTQLTVVPTSQDPDGDSVNELEASYALTLTGGNITMSNNITFITPEEIGLVNIPIGHVTGTRSISGSMTCYLSKDTTVNTHSSDLWEDLKAITNVVTNSFALTFKIGGTASNTPRLFVSMPTCHLEIPTHSIEDVISVETNFNALPSTIDGTNEVTLQYLP
tara:strand:+ start:149 stop:1411 length:1263 start_codon:yes stop_codon:yes gene_type:complete